MNFIKFKLLNSNWFFAEVYVKLLQLKPSLDTITIQVNYLKDM